MFSSVPSGHHILCILNQPLRGWLISIVAPRQNAEYFAPRYRCIYQPVPQKMTLIQRIQRHRPLLPNKSRVLRMG